jgi:hypothetical protein
MWNHDQRCSPEHLTRTELQWIEDHVIADNAENKSRAHVLAAIAKAENRGGSCDSVLFRLRRELGVEPPGA